MAISTTSSFAHPWLLFNSSPRHNQPTHVSSSSSSSSSLQNPCLFTSSSKPPKPPLSVSTTTSPRHPFGCCLASKHERSSVKKRPPSRGNGFGKTVNNVDVVDDIEEEDDDDDDGYTVVKDENPQGYRRASAIPKPPAGFILGNDGRVLMVSPKRITTMVDATNNLALECVIRRVFRSSGGEECMLLCPVDMPVQVVKSTSLGWSDLTEEEMEAVYPASAYALAKMHIHLVQSGFCYTARGGFCYAEGAIFEISTDKGPGVDGIPTEAVEVACFHQDGIHYMIYTPSDPLLFIAVKDSNGVLQIVGDDLMEDPAVEEAIDEETEFDALAEEEAALLESTLGECYDSD